MDPQPRQAMDIVNKSFNPPAAMCPQNPSLSPTSSGALVHAVPLASNACARNDDGHEDGVALSETEAVGAVATTDSFNDSLYDFSADVSIDTAQFGDLVNDDIVLTESNRASTVIHLSVFQHILPLHITSCRML